MKNYVIFPFSFEKVGRVIGIIVDESISRPVGSNVWGETVGCMGAEIEQHHQDVKQH